MGEQRSGFSLSPEENLRAEELLNELQDRLTELRSRGDDHVTRAKKRGYASNFTPDTYTVKFGDSIIVIKDGQRRVAVSHNGRDVARVFASNLDLIDLDGLDAALVQLRMYMILDDLANI